MFHDQTERAAIFLLISAVKMLLIKVDLLKQENTYYDDKYSKQNTIN